MRQSKNNSKISIFTIHFTEVSGQLFQRRTIKEFIDYTNKANLLSMHAHYAKNSCNTILKSRYVFINILIFTTWLKSDR